MAVSVTKIFSVVFSDPVLAVNYQAQYPNGLSMSPTQAAVLFNIPLTSIGTGGPAPRIDLYGISPTSILTPGGVTNIPCASWPNGSISDGDGNITVFQGGTLPADTSGTICWLGNIINEAISTPTSQILKLRRFICGHVFLSNDGSEGLTSNITDNSSRDSGRTVSGRGFAYRNLASNAVESFTFTGATASWERMYIRQRPSGQPSATTFFWATNISGSGGLALAVEKPGIVALYQKDFSTRLGTILNMSTDQWYRLDLLFKFTTVGSTTVIPYLAYVGGSNTLSGSYTFGTGGLTHTDSVYGCVSGSGNGLEMDITDISGRDYPETLNGLDWLHGSHIVPILPTALASDSSGNWAGDYRMIAGVQVKGQDGSSAMTSSSSASRLSIQTDYIDRFIGCAAFNVNLYNGSTTTSAAASLGWRGSIGSANVESRSVTANAWQNRLWPGPGTVAPVPLQLPSNNVDPSTLVLTYDDGTLGGGTGTQSIFSLSGSAEYIGDFGPEDNPISGYPPNPGIHQAPYPNLQWSNTFTQPIAPIAVMSGTYVGNGTAQNITFTEPPYWYWVRPLTSGQPAAVWWSSMITGHNALHSAGAAHDAIRVKANSSNQAHLEVTGSTAESNANSVTYQWVAVGDPGQRFMTNGAFSHNSSVTSFAEPLNDRSFNPVGAFIFPEIQDGSLSTRHYFKGAGHGTDTASLLDSSVSSGIATFGNGQITTTNTIHTFNPQTAYSAWRKNDGTYSGVVDIMTYTGNGAGGTRNITVAICGASPLFALVVPHNGAAYFRDPSHTGTNSQTVAGANSTTAIVGGDINTIQVGTTLNQNSIVYDVFVIQGVQNLGGWSPNVSGYASCVPPIGPPGPYVPATPNGWWWSTNSFTGATNRTGALDRPTPPRDWAKLKNFATGTSSHYGGFPAASAIYNNHIIYPGNAYTVGTDNPPIRLFDGQADREISRVPPTGANATPQAIVSMFAYNGIVYFTTLDTGTTSSNFAGRVFSFDPATGQITPIGAGFSSGEVPYSLAWHMGRLWCGTNKSDGSASNIYFFRPGLDTSWTLDHALSGDSMGACLSLASYQGQLFAGCDAQSGTFAKVLVRSSSAVWSTSTTATGGAAQTNNGFTSLIVFNGNLYATYWNPDTSNISKVYQYNNTSWSTVYNGSGDTLQPYILQFQAVKTLFIMGGGFGKAASLISTPDGVTFTDLTPFLILGPVPETGIPTYGIV